VSVSDPLMYHNSIRGKASGFLKSVLNLGFITESQCSHLWNEDKQMSSSNDYCGDRKFLEK
jgi:hypothetical protein